MTKLLQEALGGLRELPENVQDMLARQIIRRLRQEDESGGER